MEKADEDEFDNEPGMYSRTSTIIPPKLFFNHQEFGQYADPELDKQN